MRLASLFAKLGLSLFSALVLFVALETAARQVLAVPPALLPDYSPLFLKFAGDLQKPFFKPVIREGKLVLEPARSVDIYHDTRFEAKKPAKRLRIICVGESTVALGDFTRSLSAYLRAALDGVDLEVINAGQGFVNPTYVLKIFREMLDYQPDALVVYMGHNFRHEIPQLRPATFWLLRWAGRSRAVCWVVYKIRSSFALSSPRPHATSPQEDFERSLMEMATLARVRGVPLVFCTAASNLLLPPHFSPDRFSDPARRLDFGAALLAFETGYWDRASRLFSDLAGKEDGVALLHYFMGMASLRLQHGQEALRRFSRARDLDFDDRAPDALNRVVRRLSAGETQYRVADVEREFEAAAVDGIPGLEFFIDQCHPRRQHYRLIARPVARALERAGLASGRWRHLTPKEEARALVTVSAPEDRPQVLNSLLNTAFITTLNATYYGEAGFSEIPTHYFEEAFRLDLPGILKRLDEPNSSGVLSEVFSPIALSPLLRRQTRALGLVHAGAALRRMGRDAQAEKLWRVALLGLDGRFAAQLRLQQAVLARRQGRGAAVRQALDFASSASPEIEQEPLYLALRAEL